MEPFLGQIQPLPYNFTPKGWMPCDGRLLPIAQYSALFSLLGTTYGGDGIQTFAIPNVNPLNTDNQGGAQIPIFIAIYGVYPSRE